MTKRVLSVIIVAVVVVAPMEQISLAQELIESIELWLRTPGMYQQEKPPEKAQLQSVLLKQLKHEERRIDDLQYGAPMQYRGVALKTLVNAFGKLPATIDTALLHFKNGMAIPVTIKGSSTEEYEELFVATEFWDRSKRTWRRDFAPITRSSTYFSDANPLVFKGNKPTGKTGCDALDQFTAWRFVDSLRGIEFINSRAYYRQLDVVSDAEARRGWKSYQASCQFCHGVREIGAQFGWDFVNGISAKWRALKPLSPGAMQPYQPETESLYHHLKYRVSDARARGIQMPALPHMTKEEVNGLWKWLRAIALNKLKPYQP